MRSLSYLALGGVVLGGYLWTSAAEERRGAAPVAKPRAAKLPVYVAPTPAPALPDAIELGAPEEIEDATAEPEPVRGHAQIEDAGEFAMVFTVGNTSYIRLANDEIARDRGGARLHVEDGVYSAIAPVAINALPARLQGWAGKTVFVDGVCRARVVGFAEVTRVAGEPGEPEWDEETNEYLDPEPWTLESIAARGTPMLVGVLDNCAGTWARAKEYARAAVATSIDDPALDAKARADLLGDDDVLQKEWADMGGEGRWQDAADVVSAAFQHPLTNERWIFVQARREGHCGEPAFHRMAAYRVGSDGAVQRFADLEFGYDTIREVVDLDGDGQPELLLGTGDRAALADLANEFHESIDVPYHSYGCGC